MRLIGDLHIEIGERHGVSVKRLDGDILKPYLFLHREIERVNRDTELTLAPSNNQASHILDMLVEANDSDGLYLWFCAASHHRYRLQRHLCRNVVVISSGEWGSTAIAITRDDQSAHITFRKDNQEETVYLANDAIARMVAQKDVL